MVQQIFQWEVDLYSRLQGWNMNGKLFSGFYIISQAEVESSI